MCQPYLTPHELVDFLSEMPTGAVGRICRPGVEIDGRPRAPGFEFITSGSKLLMLMSAGQADLNPEFRDRITWEHRAKNAPPPPIVISPMPRAVPRMRQTNGA